MWLKWFVIAQAIVVSARFLLGGAGIESILIGAVICFPQIASYFVLQSVSEYDTNTGFMGFFAVLCVYLANSATGVALIVFYSGGIRDSLALSAAEGYWLLFSWGAAMTVTLPAAAVGYILGWLFVRASGTS